MMRCDDVVVLAADVALGFVSGDERAAALAHLESCASCRALVDDLSFAADAVALVAPMAEPSVGFEDRVLAALDVPVRPTGARWRVPVLASVAAAAVLIAAGGIIGRLSVSAPRSPQISESAMVTPAAQNVGELYVYRGDSPWVFVSVPRWQRHSQEYYVRVELDDGTTAELAAQGIASSEGSFAVSLPHGDAHVITVALVDDAGLVFCSGTV